MQAVFSAIERASEGTLIVDAQGCIVWISERHAKRFGMADAHAALGRPVEEVIPNSRMREVLESGEPILLDVHDAPDKPLVVVRLPLERDSERIGALGIALVDEWSILSPLVARFHALQQEQGGADGAGARAPRPPRYTFSDVVAHAPAMLDLKRAARRAAATTSPVLLLGETGTGKELLAHAIHAASARAHQPFVSVSLAAVPESQLEAEMFGATGGGHGASPRGERSGKLALARGGTLFLDEIGDLPLPLQGKLLRMLQEQHLEAPGADATVRRADVRVVAASSRDLPELVRRGVFRADLYYRLAVLTLRVPPLRERPQDLEPLCEALLEQLARPRPGFAPELQPQALELLARHSWPGNVRELRNVLERALIHARSPILGVDELRQAFGTPSVESNQDLAALLQDEGRGVPAHADAMGRYERTLIERALAESPSVVAAARRLGMGRATLYRKIAAYGISTRRRPPL